MSISCDECAAPVVVSDKIVCAKCARPTCKQCDRVTDELYCQSCAEFEFGQDDDAEPDEDDLADFIQNHASTEHVGDLAAAIRRGDTAEAEILLDLIASYVPGWSDAVSIGRFSWRAKAA